MKQFVYVACAAALLLAGCGGGTNSSIPNQQPVDWVLQAGASGQNEALQALKYYPASITINAGDSLTWKYPAGEPHTVTFLGPKTAPPAPNDPTDAAPAGGTSYDGSAYTSSGFLLGGQTYTLTFPKAGTYTYYCLIHGGMSGTVVVQDKGSSYPLSAVQMSNTSTAQIAADLNSASSAVSQFPYTAGGPHLAAGIAPGLGNQRTPVSVVRFLDGNSLSDTSVTVAAGTTVTWTNLDANLPHTVTIAAAGQTLPAMAPFSPPAGGNTYDGSTLVNSGVLMPGQSFSLTFTKPGTYTYYCLFHDDTENMVGTVVVQ